MSSKLRKKNNKKINKFLNTKESQMFIKTDVVKSKKNGIVTQSFKDALVVGLNILHDKYGFGKKRIDDFDGIMDLYLEKASLDERYNGRHLADVLLEKYEIDIKNKANKVNLYKANKIWGVKDKVIDINEVAYLVNATLYNLFSYIAYILKLHFGFSRNKINECLDYILDWIDTLSRYEQFGLTVKMLSQTLMEECQFYDERYFKKNGSE